MTARPLTDVVAELDDAPVRATHTPPRSVRIPDDLWNAAKAAAEANGETVTDVIVRALQRYVKRST